MNLINRDDLISRFEKAIKVRPELESGLYIAIAFALSAPVIESESDAISDENGEEDSPARAIWVEDKYFCRWLCGNCGAEIIFDNQKECRHCGRKILRERLQS